MVVEFVVGCVIVLLVLLVDSVVGPLVCVVLGLWVFLTLLVV